MRPHQKIEQLQKEHSVDSATLEPMRLFFIGDLPANKILNVPRVTRQSKIFDQFAHREMLKRMRSRNARNFKPMDTLDTSRLGDSLPRPNMLRSQEFRLEQSASQTPYNSYLLKQRMSQVRARLPSILYNHSVAQVLELVGNSPQQITTPDLAEYQQIQRKYSEQKQKQDNVVRLADLVLPHLSVKISESQRTNQTDQNEEKNGDTISTECQSPEKAPTAPTDPQSPVIELADANATRRIKQIVDDIVTKVKTDKTPARKSVNKVAACLPAFEIQPSLGDLGDRPVTTRCVKKGYIVHDEGLHNYWTQFKNTVHNRGGPPTYKTKLPSTISADQYCILNLNTMEFLVSATTDSEIEVASLSKVVTALLTILVCRKYSIDMKSYRCRVSDEAAEMPGTSAELEVGDVLTIEDLLYALMLPSGNDAATVLAECIGKIIQRNKKKPSLLPPSKTFVRHMNILYKQLLPDDPGTEQLHLFQNPSGLSYNPNKTSAEQITLIAAVAIKNEVFRKVVSTKEYETGFKNQRYGLARRLAWKNTNKLLWKDWQGVKTGTTETAGHCFIGRYQDYLVSVFDCATMNKRFSDAQKLADWLSSECRS